MLLVTQTAVILGKRYSPLHLCRRFEPTKDGVGYFKWCWSGDKAHVMRFDNEIEAMKVCFDMQVIFNSEYDYDIVEE